METNAPFHVLLIEDSPEDRADLRQMLLRGSQRHYKFTEAETGTAGIRAVLDPLDTPPDCVLLDYTWPDMDALAVLSALHAGGELTVCPVVVVTGSLVDGARVIRGGAEDYLGKGWATPESVTRAVENAVERHIASCARLATEAALRLANERFDLAVKCSQVVLFQQDLELRYTWLQNAVMGFEDSHAIGKRDADLMERAADAALTEALKREVIRSGVSQRQEVLIQIAGAGRHYDLLEEPLRDAAGLISGVTCAAIDITERKQAEQARHEMERNYLALAAASSEIAYRMSADWSTMLPLDGHQLVRSSDQPLADWEWLDQNLPPEEHPRVRQAIREAIARKTLFELEHRVRRPDGSIGWTFSRAVPILDENKAVIAWFGAASDITERKQAEQRLLVSEARFRRVFESNVIGIIRWDLDRSLILDANAEFLRMTGYVRDDSTSGRLNFRDLTPPEWTARNEEGIRAIRADGHAPPYEKEYFRKDGTRLPLIIAGTRFEDSPSEGMSFLIDLTELKQTAAVLRERTELLNGVLEGTTDVIFVKDLDGRLLLANAACASVFSSTAEQVVGQTAEELCPPDLATAIRQHDEAVIAGGMPIQLEERFLVAGEARVYLTLKAPLRDGSSRVVGILGISRDITERKQAEEALRASEEFNRSLMEGSADCVKVLDMDGRVLQMNPAALCLMEIDDFGAVSGEKWSSLWPAETAPGVERAVETACNGDSSAFQAFCPTAKGTPRWWDVVVSPVRNAGDGAVVRLLSVSRDLTTRKAAEEALRESEERLRLVLSGGKMGMWEWDMRSGRSVWNAMEYELLGLREGDSAPSAELFFRHVHPEDLAPMRRSIDEVRPERPDWNYECRIIRADGARRWLAAVGRTHYDADGQPERMVGVNFDITEHKETEGTLRANEQRMSLATAATEVGIWDWNLLTGFVRWDAQMFQIYGVAPTADGFVSYDTWSRSVMPEDLARQEEVLMDTVRRIGQSTREFRIFRADDGECRWIHAVETVRANAQGKAEWVIGTNLDVTARKNAERTIREEAERKDEFLAMLGHELRNPLNAIRHAVQISGETPDDAEACQWAAKVIDRQSQQLSRMVDDLLDVARINRGRIDLRVEALDLGPVLEQAIAVVRPILAQQRQTFTSDIGSPLRVSGDAARLQQVFGNLLTNAAKYTPENGSISLHARDEDGEIVVTITDNGVGIPAELLPHVFDLFRQADSTLDRAMGGLGIGLSVVKSLIEMHLGRVTVESAGANAGTTVTVRLPLIAGLPTPAKASILPAPADALPPSTRVLVVDDHEDAAQALARLLKRRGCEVALAHTGPAGVATAREFLPEVLLIDLGLPGFDGYELARLLRAEAAFAEAYFIAISGYAQEGDRARCLATGFDAHFAKPLNFPRLMEAIRAAADRRTAVPASRFAEP